jgi:hypothetical protein
MAGIALAAVCVAGLGTGSAAQLNVGATAVGSGTSVVGDCQAGAPVRVQLTSAWVNGQGFRTTGVTVHGVNAACENKRFGVTLVNASGASLAEATGVVPVGAATTPFSAAASQTVVTSSIVRAEIVIYS